MWAGDILLKYFRNASIWKFVWRPLPLLVWTWRHSSKWDLQMLPHNYIALTSSLEEYHPPACVGYFESSLGKTSFSDFKLYFPVSVTPSHFQEIWQNVSGQNVLMVFKSSAWHRCKQNLIKYFKSVKLKDRSGQGSPVTIFLLLPFSPCFFFFWCILSQGVIKHM